MQIKRFLRTTSWLVLLLALGLALGLVGYWPRSAPRDAGTEDTSSSSFAPYLARLEAAVDEQRKSEQQTDGFSANLRTAAIRLSMAGPLAFVTQQTLTGLGDSPVLRGGLFFLMPLAGWMSEPFLYPLQSDQDPGPRLQQLMAARAKQGIAVTLDNVGDASHSAQEAADYQAFYRNLMQTAAVNGQANPLFVSLKLSALVDDLPAALDVDGAAKRAEILNALRELLRSADGRAAPVFIRIDMEEYAYKDLTLQLFRELMESAPRLTLDRNRQARVGLVIQAYLRDSASDLVALDSWGRRRGLRVPVRLVKGAYLDYERSLAREQDRPSPVWDHKASTDASYLMLAEFLLHHPERFDARFATHNMNTQAQVMALAGRLGYRPDQIEFQMLYGMGEPIKAALVQLGYHLREYVPAGSLNRGLGYAGRRFAELANPQNALARTLRGDYSALTAAPEFLGEQDQAAARAAMQQLIAADRKWPR